MRYNKSMKWVEDKSENYRGNYNRKVFKFDNCPEWFEMSSMMSYSCLRSRLKKLGKHVGASAVFIEDDDCTKNPIIVNMLDEKVLYYRMKPDWKYSDERIYYDEADLFNLEGLKNE